MVMNGAVHTYGRGQLHWCGKSRTRTFGLHSTQAAQLGHSRGPHSQVYKLVSHSHCDTISQSKSHCEALMEERESRSHFVVASMSKVLCRGMCAGFGPCGIFTACQPYPLSDASVLATGLPLADVESLGKKKGSQY